MLFASMKGGTIQKVFMTTRITQTSEEGRGGLDFDGPGSRNTVNILQ
jgi:hypothetical protein